MDILAHTLWTAAAARKINKTSEKKGKQFKFNLIWTAFWGIFPDLFAFSIPFLVSFYNVIIGGQKFLSFNEQHKVADNFNFAHSLYQYSHSLIIFAIVLLVVWAIRKRPPWVLLGWVFHILIDIPSHSLAFYPTPFLFPISSYRFSYGVAWSSTWFMIINYTALILVWGSILLKKYIKTKGISPKS